MAHYSVLILEDFNQLVNICIYEQEKNATWKWLLKEYKESYDLVKKKDEYTNDLHP